MRLFRPRWLIFLLIVLQLVWAAYEIWPERPTGEMIRGYGGIQGTVYRTPNLEVQFWYKGDLFATRDRFIFRSGDKGMLWEKVAKLAPATNGFFGSLKDWVVRLKLVRNLRSMHSRISGTKLLIIRDGTVLAAAEGIYRGRLVEGKIVRLNRVHKGPMMLHQGWAENRKGIVFFGEYQCGNHTVTNLFWSRNQGRSWNLRNKFPRTKIRHIHSVAYDPYRDLLWVATGDSDHESQILYSSDQGGSFRELGRGSQDWRAVSLQFTPKAIYWGTDSPQRQNHIYRWDWGKENKEILLTVRNAFYYSAQDGEGNLFFSTAVESPEKYQNSTFSDIFQIRYGNLPHRIASWQKGKLNMYGTIPFAQGISPPGWLAFTPINLNRHHCEALVVNVNE